MSEDLIKYLDSKFRHWHGEKYKRWDLHSFDYFGCDYGFELILKNGTFQLKQLVDSGYNPGFILLETKDFSEIDKWVYCFAPTNPEYKTQRK